ncbi:bifunctional [glutamine synthetase] adenylyltransferase/[glutamine synthetase]-adenylyl-L-tyrosine phosphorylase [Methyloceanibacter sp.]|uniref:bifunctional [glutamine synthetase] adenylyltransferase/[glutamine synthetase]-adenylyl-L-tyrosine phosphorylase n=1 Tax=Methyloceanibacter sp. TaxID=1965321 RepID=UPI002BA7F1EE|nr:bifunctional [glutamine synthetase] adenylyltransferase/[glutamine synthetase]-adenylyl-L-tyrosine phosphorylase [Methyloceanibacter sp.]HML91775.1 bifunctional [glutamine synthetase] adenylyltransferase/[glutamine synthetase]-adenylyl-L-tyrosine phosphorylase [Methyloceanibacter sp.]
MTALAERLQETPEIFDAARGADILAAVQKALGGDERWAEAAQVLQSPKVASFLTAVFSGSSYLAALSSRSPDLLAECLMSDPDAHQAEAGARLEADLAEGPGLGDAMAMLRRFKQRSALLTALADLGGVWTTQQTLKGLSDAADTAIRAAVAYLFHAAHEAGKVTSPEVDGYFVIAMGKLGAGELNYSSDVDFMVFYDLDRARLAEGVEPSPFFVKITRDLVRLLQEQTKDGYVYRTDLRLRPDPGATQVALSTEAGLIYYEGYGQNWERAALIKARISAGDAGLGEAFLKQLLPFVWRKYLDFAAVADIHAMKRRVHEFKGHGAIAVRGHDIKLGRGGIRDIEFFVQTQQLITGGRHPELRTRGTLETLARLAEGGWIEESAAQELSETYLFMRRVENRIQMTADQQTHIVPADPAELDRLARLCGFADTDAFGDALLAGFKAVERHYGALFEKLPQPPSSVPGLVVGDDADPEAVAGLQRLGFENPAAAIEAIRAWQAGRYPATRSAKARERLTSFLPNLLEAFGRTSQPDLALSTFDRVMAKMPAGLQVFSLVAANPSLLRLVADIMGTAPRLAKILSRRPRLLDAVLDPGFFGAIPTEKQLKDVVGVALALATDYQDALDRARIVGREQGFLIGVRVISGTISAEQAGKAYAALADTLIQALADRVGQELVTQHGHMPDGMAAIIAMGKLGGEEMTASSDLDLITVYDYAGEDAKSDGERELPGQQYYTRFTQRLIAALSAQTAEGALYEVDMRLRPSGSQGPVATKLSGFIDYQEKSAWVWEHLALTRARVVSGPAAMRETIDKTIRAVLTKPRDRSAVAGEVHEMRRRIAAEKGTDDIWDLKQVRGGIVDLEFIAQYLQIVNAAERPEVLDQNTEDALAKLAAAGVLGKADAELLIPAARLYQSVTQILRLCLEDRFDVADAPRALRELLARSADLPDFSTLEATLKDTLSRVHDAFNRLVS